MSSIEMGGLIIAGVAWLGLIVVALVALWGINRFWVTHRWFPLLLSVACVCYLVWRLGIVKI